MRALVKAGSLPSYVRHYNLQLYELLFDLSEKPSCTCSSQNPLRSPLYWLHPTLQRSDLAG